MKKGNRTGKEGGRPAGGKNRTRRPRNDGTDRTRTGSRKSKTVRAGRRGTGKNVRSSGNKRNGTSRRKKTGAAEEAAVTLVLQNRLSMFLAGLVVVILLIAVAVNAVSLNRKLHENKERAQVLQQEIRAEEQRAADIEEYRRYTETDAYIEEIAREKLGLIYEGETVFKEEK